MGDFLAVSDPKQANGGRYTQNFHKPHTIFPQTN
jgi:hypothetical protein